MLKRTETIRTILRCIYYALFMVPVVCFVMSTFFGKEPGILYIPELFLIFAVSFHSRTYLSYIQIFVVHTFLAVILFLLPGAMSLKCILTAILVVNLIFSEVSASKTSIVAPIEGTAIPAFIIVFICYMYGYYGSFPTLARTSYIVTVILLALYIFMIYMDGMQKYFQTSYRAEAGLINKSVKTNNIIVFCIVSFMAFCVIFGNILFPEKQLIKVVEVVKFLFAFIVKCFMFLFRYILILFGDDETSDEAKEEIKEVIKEEDIEQFKSTSETVWFVFVYVLVFLVVYKILVKIIKNLIIKRQKFDLNVEITTINNISEVYARPKERVRPSSIENRIRRQYKNKILKDKAAINPKNNMTAQDIKTAIDDKGLYDATEMTRLYSDVRYGNVKVDSKLLKRMNRLTK